MNPTSLELLRHAVLRQLDAALPASLPSSTLILGLRAAGFDIDEKSLFAELIYLEQKGLLQTVTKALNTTPRYRLASGGRDYLQAEGLSQQ